MPTIKFCSFLLLFLNAVSFCYGQNTAELLGYPKDAKLLIIHADDLGVSHSENMASIKGLEESPVNSASIMVPCPWFLEIANYARLNSTIDFGLHLTLNSEWTNYKWGPVTAKDAVHSLVDKNGYFFDNIPETTKNGKPAHVELELVNQVEKALSNNIDVTHLDTHMGTAGATKDFLARYIKVGNTYELPVLLVQDDGLEDSMISNLIKSGNQVVVDKLYTASPSDYENGMDIYYTKVLNDIKPGLSTILIHLAYNDVEMRAITVGKEYWGAAWRQADVDYFSSEACKKLLKDNNIILVTWREIRDKIIRQGS